MILTLLFRDVVMGASSAHHAVRAPVSDRYVCCVMLFFFFCVGLLLGPTLTRQSVPLLHRQFRVPLHLTWRLLPPQTPFQLLFLLLLQSVCFLLVDLNTMLACRKRFDNVEGNALVLCAHSVHVQLDHCSISSISNERILFVHRTDNFLH